MSHILISEKGAALIRALGVSSSHKQFLMFVEVLPRKFIDVIRKPLQHVAEARRTIDNSCGFKTFHDAIVEAERVAFRLVPYVKPQNLLFIFSQTFEAVDAFFANTLLHNPYPQNSTSYFRGIPENNKGAAQENQSKHYAMIICKVSKVDYVKPCRWREQQKSSHEECGHAVTWSEVQEVFNDFCPIKHEPVIAPNLTTDNPGEPHENENP